MITQIEHKLRTAINKRKETLKMSPIPLAQPTNTTEVIPIETGNTTTNRPRKIDWVASENTHLLRALTEISDTLLRIEAKMK